MGGLQLATQWKTPLFSCDSAFLLRQRQQRELLRARRPHVRVKQRLHIVALGDELVALAASVFVLLY